MPKLPKAISSQASVGGQATPDVAGSGQGLAEIGQAVSQAGDVAGHLFEQEMNGRVSGALGQATRELHDLGLEVEASSISLRHVHRLGPGAMIPGALQLSVQPGGAVQTAGGGATVGG